MPWWNIGLWQLYCLQALYSSAMWREARPAPPSHEVIHVDFRRRQIIKVA